MGNTCCCSFWKKPKIALQQANRMFLNNIIDTIRTKQRDITNICLYIPEKDVSMRLLYYNKAIESTMAEICLEKKRSQICCKYFIF